MDTKITKKKKNLPILSWIMVILGILFILPGGYFFFLFLPFLFSGAIESTEALYIFGLICISGLAFIIGILLIYFGILRIISQRKLRNIN